MRLIFTLAAVLAAGQADAAVLKFDYLGQPMSCDIACSSIDRVISGDFTIDDTLLPVNSLLGVTLSFATDVADDGLGNQVYHYSAAVSRAGQMIWNNSWSEGGWFSLPYLLDTGFLDVFSPTATHGELSVSIGLDGRISDWSMVGDTGGTEDWVSTPVQDQDGHGTSGGPGRWLINGQPQLATVPLPQPGALLLGTALLALTLQGAARRRSHRGA